MQAVVLTESCSLLPPPLLRPLPFRLPGTASASVRYAKFHTHTLSVSQGRSAQSVLVGRSASQRTPPCSSWRSAWLGRQPGAARRSPVSGDAPLPAASHASAAARS